LAAKELPQGYGYEWTSIAYQEKEAGGSQGPIFGMAMVFVFLVLAAQYESWAVPFSVLLGLPIGVLGAFIGVKAVGLENNVYVQIGIVTLIGLAAKNAILIVEFAKESHEHGKSVREAAIEAAHLRLRPILMTSFAFILGVLPLVIARGAGSEARQALGTAVFSGMLGVTLFGLLLTPAFYVVCRRLAVGREPSVPRREAQEPTPPGGQAPQPLAPSSEVEPPPVPRTEIPGPATPVREIDTQDPAAPPSNPSPQSEVRS